MPLTKLKNSLLVKLPLDSVLQICELVFSFGDCIQKYYPKLSVKLAQSGRDLVQSVKLGVQHSIQFKQVSLSNVFPSKTIHFDYQLVHIIGLYQHCLIVLVLITQLLLAITILNSYNSFVQLLLQQLMPLLPWLSFEIGPIFPFPLSTNKR